MNRCLAILRFLIFESSVRRGSLSFAGAPVVARLRQSVLDHFSFALGDQAPSTSRVASTALPCLCERACFTEPPKITSDRARKSQKTGVGTPILTFLVTCRVFCLEALVPSPQRLAVMSF